MIHDACVELAIIYFCQILNPGFGSVGVAAKNNKNNKGFRDQHLQAIATALFPTQQELDRFHELCQDLLTARDKMIGHADADAFNTQHGTPVSSTSMFRQAWQHIDLKYWQSFLEPMRKVIMQYSQGSK